MAAARHNRRSMAKTNRRQWLVAALAAGGAAGVAAQAGFEWRAWPRGKRAPALTLQRLDGSAWAAREQSGRVLLVNFWASWCEPCRVEMPSLARLARRRQPDGLAVVAANYREAVPTVQRFVERLGLDGIEVLLDRDGAAAAAWTPRIFPSTVVFDRTGVPAGVLVGEIDWDGADAQALVEPLLAAPALRKAGL
jgi:thiol-disulfide isomerase/thioredoxin